MFRPREKLTSADIDKGLKNLIRDGLASQLMGTLTGGAFMIALALKLGASNVLIGMLAAIGPLTQLIQIPSVFLVERYKNRKAIVAGGAFTSRLSWLLIAAIPLLFPSRLGLAVFLAALVINGLFGGVAGTAWNSWMRDLVPPDRLGSFFAKRTRISIAVSIPLGLAAAWFLDYWKKNAGAYEPYGYSLLFTLGFLAGLAGILFIAAIPEPRLVLPEKRGGFIGVLFQPFADVNFRKLIIFFGSWNFAVNLAAPFFMVYMLRRLGFGLTFIVGLSILSQLTSIVFLKIWGKFTDRFSNKSVLSVAGPLFMFCILGWTFTTMPDPYFLTLPLVVVLHIFMGVSTSGVNLAAGNIGLKLAPQGQATAYLTANSLVNSAAAGLAPILGGIFADFFSGRQLALNLTWISPVRELTIPTFNLQQWDFFFVFAFVIGLYSIHRLAAVQETGEVGDEVVVRELVAEVRRGMRTLLPLTDLRNLVQFPVGIMKATVEITAATLKKTGRKIGLGREDGA